LDLTRGGHAGHGRNPHAGEPFDDDEATIAAALADVCVPALLCSLVHMTGDPSWIRERPLPLLPSSADYQCGLPPEVLADIRRRALDAVVAYRDGGCEPVSLAPEVLLEIMSFLARKPLDDRLAGFFMEDMQFEGADSRAIDWGDEIPDEVKAGAPVIVIGCGEVGPARRHPPVAGRAPLHDHREERRTGRHLVGEPVSGGACRRRQSPVLLLLRAG
jgi:4-hydroxyacetophenone monooxygenase